MSFGRGFEPFDMYTGQTTIFRDVKRETAVEMKNTVVCMGREKLSLFLNFSIGFKR
jgi:hypothetical protein